MQRAAFLVIGLAVAAPAVAEEPSVPAPTWVEVLRRFSRRPSEIDAEWRAGFAGLELRVTNGPEGDLAVARPRAALIAFAHHGDAGALAADLAGQDEGERLLGLAALGDVFRRLYAPGASRRAPGHAESVAAAAQWLATGTAPWAGQCGAIHDSLRRVARGAGFRGAVSAGIPDPSGVGHVVAVLPTARGMAVLDYGTLAVVPVATVAEALDALQLARGRVAGDAPLFGDRFLWRIETRAGRLVREWLGREAGAGTLATLLEDAPAWTGGAGARFGDGFLALDGAETADGGVDFRGGLGVLGGTRETGLEPSAAGFVGLRAALADGPWFARLRGELAAIRWDVAGVTSDSLLGFVSGAVGRRLALGSGEALGAFVLEGAGDLPAVGALLAGNDADPFTEQVRFGGALGWRGTLGPVAVGIDGIGLAEVAPAEVRTERRTVVASEARAALRGTWRGVEGGVVATLERSGGAVTARFGVPLGGLTVGVEGRRSWVRRPELAPAGDRLAGSVAYAAPTWRVSGEVAWERGRGAHGADNRWVVGAGVTVPW